MRDLPYFKFWCQKVLPLVYDDSLSYYEVLCKVVKYINELIESDKEIVDEIDKLKADMTTVQAWIDNFDYEPLLNTVKEMIKKYLVTGVYFGINDNGYFVANIPDGWDSIKFNTTGLDINTELQPEYGHLVLSY
jgi:hypothetical protein